jgi:hypothetical protein
MTAESRKTSKAAVEEVEVPEKDFEEILPPNGQLVIDGVTCDIRPLKSREFFMLMSILTGAFGTGITSLDMFQGDDSDEMAAGLAGAFLTALPHQYDRFLALCSAMVVPIGTKEEQSRVVEVMENPDTEILLEIVDQVIEREKDNIWTLVGKARAYASRWQQTFSKTAGLKTKKKKT